MLMGGGVLSCRHALPSWPLCAAAYRLRAVSLLNPPSPDHIIILTQPSEGGCVNMDGLLPKCLPVIPKSSDSFGRCVFTL